MSLQIKASALFPLGGQDWPRKLLIGGATGLLLELVFVGLAYLASEEAAFGIAPLAVIVNLPAIGYVVRAYEGVLRRDVADLPEWEGWPGSSPEGWLSFNRAGVRYHSPAPAYRPRFVGKGGIILFLGMVLMVLGVLAGMFTLFFVPIGLAGYLARRRLEAAFHPVMLWGGINEILTESVPTYVLSVGLFIAGGMLAAIPYLGPIIWPFLWFYLLLVQARLFGEICGKAM
jgi:hypothetical protein